MFVVALLCGVVDKVHSIDDIRCYVKVIRKRYV